MLADMRDPWLEIMIGRAMGRMFPWLVKVRRLPEGGILTSCWQWHEDVANESTYEPTSGEEGAAPNL